MINSIFFRITIVLILFTSIVSCKKSTEDAATDSTTIDSISESAQQVGDLLAGVDESGGTTTGGIAFNQIKDYKTFERLAKNEITKTDFILNSILDRAEATACSAVNFSSCSNNQKTRDLSGCTTAAFGTISGDITLAFTGSQASTCKIPANNDSVTRTPNFSITSLRGSVFSVSGSGQTLTRTSDSTFNLTNSGLRRTFTNAKGNLILDVSTSISNSNPITVTSSHTAGATIRDGRTLSGGSLVVTDNISQLTCTLSPQSIAWSANCSCPTSGSLTGSCTDSTDYAMTFSSTCGSVSLTKGTVTSTITLDKCQ